MLAQFILIGVLILVLVIIIIIIYTAINIQPTVNNAQRAREILQQLQEDIQKVIDPFEDLEITDLGDFLTTYYTQQCFIISGFCWLNQPNYNNSKCPRLCELLAALKYTCDIYSEDLSDNQICQALQSIPTPI